MDQVAPSGPVYQAGTLSGNPLATAAGIATLRALQRPGSYERLRETTRRVTEGLGAAAREAGVELSTCAVGGMFGFFFHPGPVECFEDAKKAHAGRFRRFFQSMLEQGVYLPPSPYEACFASLAHGRADVDLTLEAARVALRRAARIR
jgi:glutamate-1-semialdehyde 2,1-aminomutase